jgi:hypothetical protein
MNKSYWRQISYCKVLPKSIIYGSYWRNEVYGMPVHRNSLENLKEKKFKGDVSRQTRKKIMRMIDTMALLTNWKRTWCRVLKKEVKYRLGFMTLTLSSEQIHDDNTIKREILQPFLDRLRHRYPGLRFIWKAEPQQKGNIHFHITIDQYIHHTEVRSMWNACQENLGYITTFAAKFGHYNPNSTDIHSIKKIRNLSAYMGKYMAKKSKVRLMEGRVWSCSSNLSTFTYPTYTNDDNIFHTIGIAADKAGTEWMSKDYCEIGLVNLYQLLKFSDESTRTRLECDIGVTLSTISR